MVYFIYYHWHIFHLLQGQLGDFVNVIVGIVVLDPENGFCRPASALGKEPELGFAKEL